MDKFEQLVAASQLAVCVMGKSDASEFELVTVKPITAPLTEDAVNDMRDRGLEYLGVIGIV